MATKTRNRKLIDQAALQSLVRFGPQLDALNELTHTAHQSYGATVGAANVSAMSTEQAVAAARKPLGKVYDDAGLTQASLNTSLLGGDLAGLSGPGTDLLKAAGATEAHIAATHLNEAKVAALQELTNRGLQADAGRAQAVLQAGATLHSDLAQIGRSRQSIAGQAGAFQAATLGDLLETRAGRSFTAHQKALDRAAAKANNAADNATSTANTQARIDAQQQKDAANAKKGLLPNGVKRATAQQHGAVRDKVDAAVAEASPYKKLGRAKLEQLLLVGAPAETKKNPDGTSKHLAAIPKVPPLALSVALDMLYDGRVSRRNRKLLNDRGLTVKGLGYPGPLTKAQRQQAAKNVAKALADNKRKTGQAVPLF